MEDLLVSVVIAHRCLVVRIVCNNYLTSQILVRYGLTTRFDAYSHRCPVDSRRT